MKVSPDIEAAAAWIFDESNALKSGAGIDVSEGEISFARQRMRACAAGLLAGLFVPDVVETADG